MTGTKPDENIRLPMQWRGDEPGAGFSTAVPWRPIANNYIKNNVLEEDRDPDSLLNLYRSLIQLRNGHSSLQTGKTLILETGTARLYAVLRYDESEAFLVLVNVHPRDLTSDLYSLSTSHWPLPGNYQVTDIFGQGDPGVPKINKSGGLDNYIPLSILPAESITILHFQSNILE